MCWAAKFTTYTDSSTPKVAKEDITCYKILDTLNNGKLLSIWYSHLYTLGVQTPTIELKPVRMELFNGGYYTRIEEGYHSYKFRDTAQIRRHADPSCDIYRCTIPAGTIYFDNGEALVSSSIVINEKLDLPYV